MVLYQSNLFQHFFYFLITRVRESFGIQFFFDPKSRFWNLVISGIFGIAIIYFHPLSQEIFLRKFDLKKSLRNLILLIFWRKTLGGLFDTEEGRLV